MVYILFVLGFFVLIKGAEWLVNGAKAIASSMGISDLLIGLTIVAIGTSMPELVVNIIACYQGNPGLAIGNVLGSNIANILLILGATAIIRTIPVKKNTVLIEIPFSLAAALLVGFLANSSFELSTLPAGKLFLSWFDGLVILFFFFMFMAYIIMVGLEEKNNMTSSADKEKSSSLSTILSLIGGIIGLFIGGKWVVDGAVQIAENMGMSSTFIGLTVVAVGTSLPELVTSLVAARKNEMDIAVGNVIGSNIFNLLWILGISAIITPLPFDVMTNTDILVIIGATCLIILAMIIGRRFTIKRIEGIIFLMSYAAYIVFLTYRG